MKLAVKHIFLSLMLLIATNVWSANLSEWYRTDNLTLRYKTILENSVWIVPPATLTAVEYINGKEYTVNDQTVWVINTFNAGYFFGDAYVGLNGSPTSHLKLVGSITPLGNVYLTFYSTSGNVLSTDVVNGIGRFTRIFGRYAFLMQTNSAQNNLTGLSHWSYMISVKSGDYFYQNLPSVNMSVPQFISLFS